MGGEVSSGYLPEGTEFLPNAPWNQPDVEEGEYCETCGEIFDIEESEQPDGYYRGVIVPYPTDHGDFCSAKCAGEEDV
jgi:hypothetical protein